MPLHNTSITLKMISTRSINTDIIVIDVYPTESFPSLMCSRFYFFLGGVPFIVCLLLFFVLFGRDCFVLFFILMLSFHYKYISFIKRDK